MLDAGSTDSTLEILQTWEPYLAGWRSFPDRGQAAAINEGIGRGTAPFVGWLNSDDILLPGGLIKLCDALGTSENIPAVYGKTWNIDIHGRKIKPYWTAPFSERHLANRCFVSQPATLARRSAWEGLGGLDETMSMSFDYDLWWRLYRNFGPLLYVQEFVAGNRRHEETKTTVYRKQHYYEAIKVVKKYYGRVPLKWYLAKPVMVYGWLCLQRLRRPAGRRALQSRR